MREIGKVFGVHRIVFTFLVVFALWPWVHFGLTQHYELDPWKYGGWAMYVIPKLDPSVEIASEEATKWAILSKATASPQLRRETRRFISSRRVWGRLASSDALVAQVFRDKPEASAVEIRVRTFALDEGFVVFDEERASFNRPSP